MMEVQLCFEMKSNPDFDPSDNIVSLDAYNEVQREVVRLIEENRFLKMKSLELQAQVDLETERRTDVVTETDLFDWLA